MPARVNTNDRLLAQCEDGSLLTLRSLTRDDQDVVHTFVLRVPAGVRRSPAQDADLLELAGDWVTYRPADGSAPLSVDAGPAIIARGVLFIRPDGGTIHLSVPPAFRGRGLGGAILRELTSLAGAAGVDVLTFILATRVRLPVCTANVILGDGRAAGMRSNAACLPHMTHA